MSHLLLSVIYCMLLRSSLVPFQQKRIEQDKEEARIAEEKRRETLERAQRLMYQNSDRVKTFHSALMLSEVLKEREHQIEFKKYVQEQHRHRDHQYHLQTLSELKAAEEQQAKKEDEMKQKAKLLASMSHLINRSSHILSFREDSIMLT